MIELSVRCGVCKVHSDRFCAVYHGMWLTRWLAFWVSVIVKAIHDAGQEWTGLHTTLLPCCEKWIVGQGK